MSTPAKTLLLSATVCAALGVAACKTENKSEPSAPKALAAAPIAKAVPANAEASKEFNPRLLRRFAPVRTVIDSPGNPGTPEKVALGRMLYFDKRLSKKQNVSCNSCHKLDAYGVDSEPTSPGDDGARGGRNSPTVYHAAGYFTQFWDGRAPDVEEQAKGPILNPIEMGMPNAEAVVTRLKAIPGYREAFAKAFPGEANPLSYDNVGRAIGAFERGLMTPGRWDKYLSGEKNALTDAELEGLKVFTNVGCMVCHTGEFLGGSSYQRVGAVEAWPNQADPGRFKVTNNEADKMMFKVPTLRNVAKTGPYFHDGSAKTLDDAVRMMGKHQLGLELSEAEVKSIVAWLGALTGELPKDYIAAPKLPEDAGKAKGG